MIPATVLAQVFAARGAAIVKLRELEVPPPGLGLESVTLALPAAVKSLAGTLAVNSVACVHATWIVALVPNHVVANAVPFH